jgi:hypothetical protein
MAEDVKDHGNNDQWDASWEAHRRRQLTIGLGATPAQRLAWLEGAIALAHQTGALPRRGREGTSRIEPR